VEGHGTAGTLVFVTKYSNIISFNHLVCWTGCKEVEVKGEPKMGERYALLVCTFGVFFHQ
jgi:hypothetical protein